MIDTIIQGDCLGVMRDMPDESADLILCDLPYGTTSCSWDTIIPFEPLWAAYKRIIKPNGAIVLTASQPFTSALVMSNAAMFKHEWIWNKVRGTGFQIAKYRPMQQHESILVFCRGSLNYFPIMTKRDIEKTSKCYTPSDSNPLKYNDGCARTYTHRFPVSILTYSNASQYNKLHPTQKPVALFEYLIRTYTNEGEVVLDNCIGSGTTAVACIRSSRHYIGIELEQKYVDIANERICIEQSQLKLDLGGEG